MKLLSSFGSATCLAVCAALAACAGSADPATSTVTRTPPPKSYERTITNYLAFKVRAPQKNSEFRIDRPEPGDCPLDGHVASVRGWVVPVVQATRTGELAARETISITTRQYYFWFMGDTIAGITRRLELCPGIGVTVFEDAPPVMAKASLTAPVLVAAAPAEAARREAGGGVESSTRTRASYRLRAAGGQKQAIAGAAKKTRTSSATTRRAVKKAGKPRAKENAKAMAELRW